MDNETLKKFLENNEKASIYCTINKDGLIHTEAKGTLLDLTHMVTEILASAMLKTLDEINERGSDDDFEKFMNSCHKHFGKLEIDIIKRCITRKIEETLGGYDEG